MKRVILLAVAAAMICGCEKEIVSDSTSVKTAGTTAADAVKTKKFTFTLKGDFSDEWKPVTRGYLSADGKDMTDVWVLDYDADGHLLQQLHQSDNTAEDFGKPVMNLAYGVHQVYFIASRGVSPVLDTEAHTLTFGSVRDTFWKRYDVSVVATSNGNRAVTLDRVVTKLRLTFTDEVPATLSKLTIAADTWHSGINALTGVPTAAAARISTINVPALYIGTTGQLAASIFGICGDDYTTDVSVTASNANSQAIASVALEDVPMKKNTTTSYSGPLFTRQPTFTMTLSSLGICITLL